MGRTTHRDRDEIVQSKVGSTRVHDSRCDLSAPNRGHLKVDQLRCDKPLSAEPCPGAIAIGAIIAKGGR